MNQGKGDPGLCRARRMSRGKGALYDIEQTTPHKPEQR